MVSPARSPQSRFSIAKCQAAYLQMMPAIKRHARIAFRYLKPEAKQEAVQNVLCNTWAALVGLARRGKLDQAFPSILAGFGVKQTRDYRVVGGHLDIKDVLSKYCQVNKGVFVKRLDHYDDEENGWYQVLIEDRRSGPADIACTRIDFDAWLHSLPCRHRRLAQFLSLGNRTSDAARKFKMSNGRVSQLRRELAASWRRFAGDNPLPEAA